MRLLTLSLLSVLVAACGSPADPPVDATGVFTDDVGEPVAVIVRGGHVYWQDRYRRSGGVLIDRVRRSPVDVLAAQTLLETEERIDRWDASSTHLYAKTAGGTVRVPMAGGAAERMADIGAEAWVLAGDRLIAALDTAQGSDVVDVTTPGAPSILAESTRGYALLAASSDRVMATTASPRLTYLIAVPAGTETQIDTPFHLLAMIGPAIYTGDRADRTIDLPLVLRRDGEALATARQPLTAVAERGDQLFVTMGVAGSYALARVEPAAGDRPGEMVELQVPLIPSIAADSRRLFWFAQGAVTPALMVDER